MATAVEIEARLAAIKTSRDSGVLTVRHGETMTTFRSLAEMQGIIAELEKELSSIQGTKRRSRISYSYQSSKGL